MGFKSFSLAVLALVLSASVNASVTGSPDGSLYSNDSSDIYSAISYTLKSNEIIFNFFVDK